MKNSIKLLIITAIIALISFGAWRFFATRPATTAAPTTTNVDISQLKKLSNVVPVAIIGSGPAGLSASIYTSRANMHTIVFEGKKPGGQLMSTSDVENWPGMGKKTGPEIIDLVKKQAVSFDTTISQETIEKIDFSTWPFTLWTDEGTEIRALSVIIAMGANPKLLNIPGEQHYWGGKGVTACAVCDAPFFKDKDVVVIGGGDSAAEQALQLASHAKAITILVRADKMRASYAMQERLKAYPHIKIRYNVSPLEIKGDGTHVTGIQVKTAEKDELIPINGVFLAIGHIPNTHLFTKALKLDANGYIELEAYRQKTSVPGVFSAGDVSDHRYRQAGVASGDGIKAALDAINFLGDQGFNDMVAEKLEKKFYRPTKNAGKEILKISSQAEFDKEVLKSKIPVIVDFYTPTCPSCLQMLPYVSEMAAQFDTKIKFVKVDGSELPDLMQRLLVTSVPTFLVYQEGILIARATSAMTRRELREFSQKFI
jgi:thioredoxin reductase (NADPH)